jgi:hypothetical protein
MDESEIKDLVSVAVKIALEIERQTAALSENTEPAK